MCLTSMEFYLSIVYYLLYLYRLYLIIISVELLIIYENTQQINHRNNNYIVLFSPLNTTAVRA